MASKKYEPMPDMSKQDCFISKRYTNIDFRKAEAFTFNLHIFYDCKFYNCNFNGVSFNSCRFINCVFNDCNLRYTHWIDSNIEYTKFYLCSLRGAFFKDFNFYEIDFSGTILCDTVFRSGYFIESKISSITVGKNCNGDITFITKSYKGAIFNNVEFNDTSFGHFDFNKFDILGCFFIGCTFELNCKNIPYIPMTCPEEGSFIAYKKVLTSPLFGYSSEFGWLMIAVLEIPADAKRSSGAGTRKCRCNKAKILRFEDLDGNVLNDITKGYSYYNRGFIYHVGEYVTEENFDEDRWEQCSKGIHFFMNRQEAINYNFN